MYTCTRTTECRCPNCNAKIDAATCATGDDAPQEGDITICIKCAAILTFTESMTVIRAPKIMIDELDTENKACIERICYDIEERNKGRKTS